MNFALLGDGSKGEKGRVNKKGKGKGNKGKEKGNKGKGGGSRKQKGEEGL